MSTSTASVAWLSIPPANLVLILAFLLALVLLVLFRRAFDPDRWSRIALATGGMAVLRLALVPLALWATWDGSAFSRTTLGNFDRASSLALIILLVWVLLAPPRRTLIDFIALVSSGLGLVLAIGATYLLYYTAAQVPDLRFNMTLLAPLWDGLGAAALLVGIGFLLARRPVGWQLGVLALVALLGGALLQLLLQDNSSDFGSLRRGGEVVGYVLFIVWIAQQAAARLATPRAPEGAGAPATAAPLRLADESATMAQDLAFWAARTLNADVALILAPSEDHAELLVLAGYDMSRSVALPGTRLPAAEVTTLLAGLAAEGAHALPANEQPADYEDLARAVGLPRSGPSLLTPLGSEGRLRTGILLLSPYSGREWSLEDEVALGAFAEPLQPGLVGSPAAPGAVGATPSRPQALMSSAELANLRAEIQDLNFRLRQAEEAARTEREHAESLEAQIAQPAVPEGLRELEQEIGRLEGAIAEAVANREQAISALKLVLEGGAPVIPAEGEVLAEDAGRQGDELARLRLALDRAESELAKQGVGWEAVAGQETAARQSALAEQVVLSLARELRKTTLAARSGAELLMGQAGSFLGALQRQPLESLRAKVYQAEALAQDLESLAGFARGEAPMDWGALDVVAAVDSALTSSSELIRERELSLHLDLPSAAPAAEADRACVRQLLYHLVRNAILATPSKSEVAVRAHLRAREGASPTALLLSVDDGGQGISPDDYPMVFDPLARGTGAPLSGLGEKGIGMAIAGRLAEAMGGRIWVESQPGQGSTFSVEIPLAAAGATASAQG